MHIQQRQKKKHLNDSCKKYSAEQCGTSGVKHSGRKRDTHAQTFHCTTSIVVFSQLTTDNTGTRIHYKWMKIAGK